MPDSFKDYYAALGVAADATQADIKRAYRKLARKYHPDVSKESDAEARFKDVAEAHEVLHDDARRAAYDAVIEQRKHGGRRPRGETTPDWSQGFDFGDGGSDSGGLDSDFFENLFGRPPAASASAGRDQHARVQISLIDAYQGGQRSMTMSLPQRAADGRLRMQPRTLQVTLPKGLRTGQQLRLAGQGAAAQGTGPAGDLYLEIDIAPHPRFRVEDRDVYTDLPVAPWEAALGASVALDTPDGPVNITVPAGSKAGGKLRLKGRGIPSQPPGDLYALLTVSLPSANTPDAEAAYRRMAADFSGFDPRAAQGT